MRWSELVAACGWLGFVFGVVLTCGCTRQERETAPSSGIAPVASLTCGNGILDSGEACDYGVEYEDGCPDGWEICWTCDQTCDGFQLFVIDDDWGACSQYADRRLYARRKYDAWGRNILAEIDTTGDGKLDQRNRAGFTDDGQQLFWERDDDGDGIVERYEMKYDADGRVSSTVQYAVSGEETGLRWGYRHDDAGRPVLQQRFQRDVLQETVTWSYQEEGRHVSWERDSNGDGKTNEGKRSRYDARGNKTLYEHDTDGDGRFDVRMRNTYDEHDNAIRKRHELPTEGPADIRFKIEYDERGNRTRVERYEDGGAKPTECWRATYDPRGNRTLREHDTNCDGQWDVREKRFYDDDGNVVDTEYRNASQSQTTTANYDCLAETIKRAPRQQPHRR